MPVRVATINSSFPQLSYCLQSGETALQVAAKSGSTGLVRDLLNKQAAVNASDVNGMTALHKAAALGHSDIIGELLWKGANVNARNNVGISEIMPAGIPALLVDFKTFECLHLRLRQPITTELRITCMLLYIRQCTHALQLLTSFYIILA